ncbi:MAG: hypothetical protein JSV79_02440, partial [Armatimonadota bacterium]
ATSVESLALYLRQRTRDERERARAAFSWIAHNVSYDGSLRGENARPEGVLAARRAACYGYAVLFEALAEAMGIEAEIVTGHGKGRGYQPGQGRDSAQDHSWNAVKTNGAWGLVDCTWGAGHFNEQGRFVQRFTDHYFLTPPEEFAYDHLPDDPKWQLLATPISETEYLNRVHLKSLFFERGLWLVSHRAAGIQAGSSLQVTIGAPPDTALTAAVLAAAPRKDGKQLAKQYVFTQREGDGFVVRAVFPSPGSYLLRVFARPRAAIGEEFETALNYAVRALSGAGAGAGFPEVYDSFLARECWLQYPLTREIPAGQKVGFALSVPRAEEVVVLRSDDEWSALEKHGDRFWGEVLTETENGKVTVFAKFPGKKRYEGLLRYVVR